MNVPNILTIARIVLTGVFAVLMLQPGIGWAMAALVCFALAALTDWADGYLARRYQLITVFGKIMDPIADKMLTLTAFIMLSRAGLIPFWMVALIAAREVLVTFTRLYALITGTVLPAEASGKVKTVFQMTAIGLALLCYAARSWASLADVYKNSGFFLAVLINSVMMIAVILTVYSGIAFYGHYLKNKGTQA